MKKKSNVHAALNSLLAVLDFLDGGAVDVEAMVDDEWASKKLKLQV